MPDKGRLVITGASGFIGLHLVRAALAKGWRVAALARAPTRLASIGSDRLTVHGCDVRDASTYRRILSRADAVCHLAAFIPPNYADPAFAQACFEVNALGALEMARAAAEAKVGRLVHFSSGQIYAASDAPVSESHPVFPSRRAPFYLSSKLSAELFVDFYRRHHNLPTSVLRIASVYGSGMADGGMMSTFAARARQGTPIEARSGSSHRVDVVHVADVTGAALSAIERQADGTFNIGCGVASTPLGIAREIVDILGRSQDLVKCQAKPDVPVEPGFAPLDISSARQALGYDPAGPKEGIAKWLRDDISVST